MQKPFSLLRETAINVADTIGATLDEPCSVSSEGYEFEQYAFVIHGGGVNFKLSVSADDIDQHFRDAP